MKKVKTHNHVFLSFLHFCSTKNEKSLETTLKYFNRRSFIDKLKHNYHLNDNQINALFAVMVSRIVEFGGGLPGGYIDLFNFADERGIFEINE